jgi:hypothetical protein
MAGGTDSGDHSPAASTGAQAGTVSLILRERLNLRVSRSSFRTPFPWEPNDVQTRCQSREAFFFQDMNECQYRGDEDRCLNNARTITGV